MFFIYFFCYFLFILSLFDFPGLFLIPGPLSKMIGAPFRFIWTKCQLHISYDGSTSAKFYIFGVGRNNNSSPGQRFFISLFCLVSIVSFPNIAGKRAPR